MDIIVYSVILGIILVPMMVFLGRRDALRNKIAREASQQNKTLLDLGRVHMTRLSGSPYVRLRRNEKPDQILLLELGQIRLTGPVRTLRPAKTIALIKINGDGAQLQGGDYATSLQVDFAQKSLEMNGDKYYWNDQGLLREDRMIIQINTDYVKADQIILDVNKNTPEAVLTAYTIALMNAFRPWMFGKRKADNLRKH